MDLDANRSLITTALARIPGGDRAQPRHRHRAVAGLIVL
jgi:hypothetical protein